MDYVETYFKEMRDTHILNAATDEMGFYGPLGRLLNEVSRVNKLKVQCVIGMRNQGAGLPDGGFFTADQVRRKDFEANIISQIPARGVMEVKSPADDVDVIARSEQVERYLRNYGTVLVTNYRDFMLVKQDADGRPVQAERYTIAGTEQLFWQDVAHPRALAAKHSERLTEFLTRVMLHNAPLSEPKQLAWFLASYARDARIRIEAAEDLTALNNVRSALEEALGLQFEGEKGEHFFRSTLVQTLFYGLFSAWVLWAKEQGPASRVRFEWQRAQWSLHVPMISALFTQLVTPVNVRALDLQEVMEWAGDTLNRVDRGPFFSRFEETQAVQYFYEPFLEAFDPELRKELGVWYTPPEIVKYMVERVDTVLREELDIRDGLADPNVYVLDPCCGTGAYLVEVLHRIEKTLRERGEDALIGNDVKRAAVSRVFGFEILPAPFVVAHLQLGLALQNLGAPLSDERNERARVYLTNALTGWEPPQGAKEDISLPEMEEEREAASEVKRDKPILVIIGNPPYNAFAGISPKEEEGLVEIYKGAYYVYPQKAPKNARNNADVKPIRKYRLSDPISKGGWGIKKFNLDDLYIRFFRVAERRISETTGKGVVSFISNYSWAKEPSYVILRERLLESFDKFYIENMHGNRKTSEYGPDGRTSETIFSIAGFSPGIKQGVVISTWIKKGRTEETTVLLRDDMNASRAADRREQLLDTLKREAVDDCYLLATPSKDNRYSFWPESVSDDYRAWPKVSEICAESPSNGLMEKRGGALIDIDKEELAQRMQAYYDKEVEWETLKGIHSGYTDNAARFGAKMAREKVISKEKYSSERVRLYEYRPFDRRYCYYTPVRPLWNEPRPRLWEQTRQGNTFILSRVRAAADPEGVPFYITSELSDDHVLMPDAACFALCIKQSHDRQSEGERQTAISFDESVVTANLSSRARGYLDGIGIANPDTVAETAGLVWMHALAIGYSPKYLEENADGIRQDWPRIPLPDSKDVLLRSAELGRRIAALLDTEDDVDGVTTGDIRPELRAIGSISEAAGRRLDPDAGDLAVTAGWGHSGKDGVTMPGKGKWVERAYSAEELDAMQDAGELLGANTRDIYLNDRAYWRNIPERVWNYHIGGYQVIKKWLSYREKPLLGRDLTTDEVREVMNMARRIAAILMLEPELDANYEQVKGSCYPWPGE